MKNVIYDFYNRIMEWLLRPRTIGAQLLRNGTLLLLGIFAVDFMGQVDFRHGQTKLNFQFGTGAGLPQPVVLFLTAVAVLMLLGGAYLMWRDERRERRQLLIVVEVRGLHGTVDTPSLMAIKPRFRGQRHSIVVDFRPSHPGELVNPEVMLSKIHGMKLNVDSAAQGRDKGDVFVAVGGIAAVPAMFLIGKIFEDESQTELYDWDRDLRCWKMIEGLDDGKRPLPLLTPPFSNSDTEAVLAVSASYPVDLGAVAATFPGLPVVRLEVETPRANSYWSEAVQRAFAAAFRDAIQELMALQVKRIHLVLIAPVSLTLRLGAVYDDRLHPELIVYQYEKSSVPPYPWGVVMPGHGSPSPSVRKVAAATA